MKRTPEYLQKRFETCRDLFFQYKGREHARIEREMRAMGFADFNRRCLYARGVTSGWIEKYKWDQLVNSEQGIVNSDGSLQKPARSKGDTLNSLGTENGTHRRSSRRNAKTQRKPLNDFHRWIKKVSPPMFDWDAPHLRLLIKTLQLVTEGKIKRLMIFMPPRHGKSELVTIRYTAWRLLQDPTLKVILASYAQSLANRFSRNIRNTIADHFHLERSATDEHGDTQDLNRKDAETPSSSLQKPARSKGDTSDSLDSQDSPDYFSNPFRTQTVNSSKEWETGKGGGVKAVGVGGGITGYGASLMMIDDPIKSREQAESKTYRDKVWQWFNDDMMTRLEPDAPVILIQTRWHEDDLAGRLLKQQQEDGTDEWHVISLPAIAEAVDSGQWAEGSTEETQKPKEPETIMPARHLAFTTQPAYIKGKTYGEIVLEREEAKEAAPRASNSEQRIVNSGRNEVITGSGAGSPYGHPGWGAGCDRAPSLQKPARSKGDTHNIETDLSLPTVHYPLSIASDPLGRKPGEALWPQRFSIKDLERIKRQMGTYSFEALYQQKPVPTEGGLFKRSWFTKNIVQTPPPNLNWKRGFDLSFTANPESDHSATLRVAYDKDGIVYIDGWFRGRLTYPLQRKMLMHYIKNETRTEHGIELSANGHAILQDLRQMPELRGKKFRGVRADSNKITRALPWIALAEEGRIRLVKGRWNEDFITEACAFPHGQHDDQIDAVSIAIAMHGSGQGRRIWKF